MTSPGIMQGSSFCCPIRSANERRPGLWPTNDRAAPVPGRAPESRAANDRLPGGREGAPGHVLVFSGP